ncbi:MAG: FHA domain-containing protein [Nevskiales bacterium]|nr:FHA domain-containing protein [Nevskiales bacterium]
MGKLIVTDSNGHTEEFPLTKERITIGRHADNDITLNDKAVSGHHAVVITILQDSFLEDLDSTNGTQVNDRPIAKHPLSHNDLIVIGRNTLRYEGEAAADDDFEQTMILKPGQFGAAFEQKVDQATAQPGETPPTPAAEPSKPLLGKLKVISGPNAGKELELSKALTTVGKPGVQVAAITRRADGYYIVNVGSSDGAQKPLLNGQPIDSRARKLNDQDTVELMGTQMTFVVVS